MLEPFSSRTLNSTTTGEQALFTVNTEGLIQAFRISEVRATAAVHNFKKEPLNNVFFFTEHQLHYEVAAQKS